MRDKKEEALLIFITGFKEYVFEGFDVAAFHYLLKPVEEKKLTEVFAKAVAEVERKKGGEEESFLIKSKGRTILLNRKDILCLESQGRMVNIHTTKENLKIYFDMGELEQRPGSSFYR